LTLNMGKSIAVSPPRGNRFVGQKRVSILIGNHTIA
jgi:hypothetical protein